MLMIERPDADALMAGPLGQWLSEQNAGRAEVKARAAKYRWWAVLAAVPVAVFILIFIGSLEPAFYVGCAVLAVGFGIAELIKQPMLNRLKGGINGAIAKALNLEYSLTCEPGKTFELAKQFDMVPSYDNSSFQDLWWGVIAGQPFTLHEAKLTEQQGSGKSRRTVTVFEGSILSIGFNRRFLGTTLIEPDGKRQKFLFGGEKDKANIGDLDLSRIDLGDPRFEERFTVWASDQVESRYIVHPEYMERLVGIETAFSGDDIRALFHDGDLLITLKTGNLFESGSLDAGDDRTLLATTIEQFGSLADLANKMNERARPGFRDAPPV